MTSSAHVAPRTEVKPAALGISILVDPGNPTVDVVFVHGFNGHPERTWLHKGDACNLLEPSTGEESHERPRKIRKVVDSLKLSCDRKPVHWPRDLLPSTLPHARILTYGYDTHLGHRLGPSKSQKTVYDFAKDFLLELEALRRSQPRRPILFIAHSLGGIVVKEMLRQSYGYVNYQPHLRAVSDSTKGIIFFGTPHGGADPRGMLKSIAENIARAFGFTVNEQILESLLHSSERLRQLRDEFGPMARAQKWIIHCFQEDHGIKALGGRKVVEDVSSCLADASLEVVQHIADNHMDMCRFSGVHDAEYGKVVAAIDRALAGHLDSPPLTKRMALSDAERQTYVKSLRFDQIDARHATIKSAHAKTCRWLLKKTEYTDWLAPGRSDDHNGILWIKGKAGSGKSTILKYLLSNARRTMTGSTIVSFFFNARGHDMEKSTIGMYRSLLLQLFERIPDLQCALDVLPRPPISAAGEFEGEWQLETLKTLFQDAVRAISAGGLICFVDALDECDEDDVRDMLACFERLGQDALQSGALLQVCFSSRHYPHITVEKCIELVLDGQEGHRQDLANYLQSALKIGKNQRSEKIKAEVLEQANGVFLWLVLVVQILQKEFDRGRIHALEKRLTEIPPGLDELFRDILTRDGRNLDDLLLCLQWVLFAKRPLRREELYFGILADTETDQLTPWDPTETTILTMERFILDCSKGLAELTKAKLPTVQFIHESVRDYLLKGNGLSHIRHELTANFSGMSHERLKMCCYNYLELDIPELISFDQLEGADCGESADCAEEADSEIAVEVEGGDAECATEIDCEALVGHGTEANEGTADTNGISGRRAMSTGKHCARSVAAGPNSGYDKLRATLLKRYPFLEYAVNYVYAHAEAAYRAEMAQETFFAQFDLKAWIARNNALEKFKVRRYSPAASWLYILADKGLPGLVHRQLERETHMEIEGERYNYPLTAAVARRDESVVREFLRPAADRLESDNCNTSAAHPQQYLFDPVSFVLHHRTEILDLKKEPIMVWALGRGEIDLVSAFLATGKVQVSCSAQISRSSNLLLRLTLEQGASPISVDLSVHRGSTKSPSSTGDIRMVGDSLRISHFLGIVVEWARWRKYQLLVRHFIWQVIFESMEANQNSSLGVYSMVRPLLSDDDLTAVICEHAGANLSSLYGGALRLLRSAQLYEMHGLVRHMLQHSTAASLSQVDTSMLRNVLETYLRNGDGETTQLLWAKVSRSSLLQDFLADKQLPFAQPRLTNIFLQSGVSSEILFVNNISFLDWQLKYGDEARVWLSIQKNPEIDARNDVGMTILALAAKHGRAEIVRLLMKSGADVNSLDQHMTTPLFHAVEAPGAEVVTGLILPNTDVHIDDVNQGSQYPTFETTERGCTTTVRVLLQCKDLNVNAQDKDGRTALCQAVFYNKIGVVRLLLERPEIDLSARAKPYVGSDLFTAAELANRMGRKEIQTLLQRN